MAHIVMPTTATRQGGAFEVLILSHYRRSGQYIVLGTLETRFSSLRGSGGESGIVGTLLLE
jgi:hypothetical protein